MGGPVKFEFENPYKATFTEGLSGKWLKLESNGILVASFSVETWGSEQKCIEAAWNYAYLPEDGGDDTRNATPEEETMVAHILSERTRIEQLERELAEARVSLGNMGQELRNAVAISDAALDQLAAEKALADRLIVAGANALQGYNLFSKELSDEWDDACAAYRKARGL